MLNNLHQVNYGSKHINYNLSFTTRKSLGIKVTPNGDVNVLAPINTELIDINQKIKSKANWILKQLSFFNGYKPFTPTRKFVNGETHLYLGRQYLLQVYCEQLKMKIEYVKLYQGKLTVYTNNPTPANIEKMINKFYKNKAIEIITPLFENCKKLYTFHSSPFTEKLSTARFLLRNLKKRWGSCTKAGKIILNTELIKAPKACIEYVIIHELCHLIHYNHNKNFYALLNKIYPNWAFWKQKLEQTLV